MKWKLRVLMDIYGDSLEDLANYLGITYQTLSKKMNSRVDFTLSELRLIQKRYNLTAEQVYDTFFIQSQ